MPSVSPSQRNDALDESLRRRIVRTSAWVGLGTGGGQVISFLSTLVLARLLAPSAFGIVAVCLVVLGIVAQIQSSGVGAALIQRRDPDIGVAAASALVYASTAGAVLTLGVIACAPLYGRLVGLPDATPYLQALAGVLMFRGLAVVPDALLERELEFRRLTRAQLGAAVVQTTVAIGCAMGGLGAWSLVAGHLAGAATSTLLVWMSTPFVPSPGLASRTVTMDMLRYGRHVSGSNILVIVNLNLDNVIVARFLGASAVGTYAAAWRIAEIPDSLIGLTIGRVMFSVYSGLQSDVNALRAAFLENLQRVLLFALPVTAVIGLAAEPIVLGLLGEPWSAAVDPLRLLCIFTLLRMIAGPCNELLKGIGRPHLSWLLIGSHTVVALPALLWLTRTYGTVGAALAMLLAGSAALAVGIGLTTSALDLSPRDLGGVVSRPAACTAVVSGAVLAVLPITTAMRPIAGLLVVGSVATLAFIGAAALLARPVLRPIISGLRRTPST